MTRDLRSRTLAALVIWFLATVTSARADVSELFREMFARSSHVPHPSIVQVLAPDREALSRGSGTLIHVDGQFGYVITNWHVVRDAEREVLVIFPDGYQSLARILKMNKDWDLALLLIWAGTEQPMPLATVGPRPGDDLQIAGYGAGDFRAQRGRFSTFAAPQPDMPFEMFEVAAIARQGDSGGPIINQRGELVGVLFGAGDGRTTGTQIGRVRMFVNEAFDELRNRAESIAKSQPANVPFKETQPPALATNVPSGPDGQGGVPPFNAEGPGVTYEPKDSVQVAMDSAAVERQLPVASPPAEVHAPIGKLEVAAAPNGWQPSPTKHNSQEPKRVADGGEPSAPPWPDAVPQNHPSRDPRAESIVKQHREAIPPRMSDQNPVEEDMNSHDTAARVADNESEFANQVVARKTRPAEISRRDLVGRDSVFQANRGMRRAAAAAPAAIGAEQNAGLMPTAVAAGIPPHGSGAMPISGGVTWEQIKSFFAAVGVFAVLHAIVKTFGFTPAVKSKR